MNEDWKWHYFMMHGFEYLVLGYSPEKHNILCVGLNSQHSNDKKELLRLVDTDEAQREAYLVAILARHPYAGGGTWWEHLQPYVFFAEFGQIERCGIAPGQIKIFRDKWHAIHPDFAQIPLQVSEVISVDAEQNSTPEVAKTENIDDILFGYILSEEDREDVAIMKHRAGLSLT